LVKEGFDLVGNPFKRKLSREELIGLLDGDVRGIIAGLEPLDREVLARSSLRVISRCGSGLSNVDLAAAAELGIVVCATPDGPTAAVAELTVGALLALLRMLPQMDRDLHEGRWHKRIGSQLEGKTVAIVGCGRIGRRVAALLSAFGATVLGVDPALRGALDGIRLVPLAEALAAADIVTLHCSGEARVLGPEEFRRMKPGTLLLNAARGGLVDEAALVCALDEGRVAGAWLDAFEEEPYDGPLTRYPQVLLTPHVGSYTKECRARMEMEAAENLIRAMAGGGGARS
jgi:D-3-phosphoglycerate dehydrogenase